MITITIKRSRALPTATVEVSEASAKYLERLLLREAKKPDAKVPIQLVLLAGHMTGKLR